MANAFDPSTQAWARPRGGLLAYGNSAAVSEARLCIHAGDLFEMPPAQKHPRQAGRSWPGGRRRDEREPVTVRIEDIHGRQVFETRSRERCIDTVLDPGRFQVHVEWRSVRRTFAAQLDHGGTFDLFLSRSAFLN